EHSKQEAAGGVQPPSVAPTGPSTARASGLRARGWRFHCTAGRLQRRRFPMRLPQWLRSLVARPNRTPVRSAPRRPACRPRLEALEDRLVPSATLVKDFGASLITTDPAGAGAPGLVRVGSWLYFGVGGVNGQQLWRTDGTPAHTTQVESGSQSVSLYDWAS